MKPTVLILILAFLGACSSPSSEVNSTSAENPALSESVIDSHTEMGSAGSSSANSPDTPAPTPPAEPTPPQLSEYQRISSEVLHYDLQYKVYLPKNYNNLQALPVAYITDGEWFLEESIEDSISLAIEAKRIPPVIAVFLDARDPDNLSRNRRNKQFICNSFFVRFFNEELIPNIDKTYKTSPKAEDRSLHGMSFGGLFTMYYAGQSQGMIGNLAIMSAATHPCKSVFNAWELEEAMPVKVFLSVGTKGDTDYAAYRLKPTLEEKGYDFTFTELPYGHVRKVWRPLVDDALEQFFGDRVKPE